MRCRHVVPGLAVLAVAIAGDLPAQAMSEPPLWKQDRTAAFFAENDALGGGSDSAYTNGVRATWSFMTWPDRADRIARVGSLMFLIDRVWDSIPSETMRRRTRCVVQGARAGRPCGFLSFGLGQTMYTPSTLLDTMPRPDERPYAGMLFATLGLNTSGRRVHYSTELLLGVLGPASGAEATQSLAHWTWSPGSVKPRGWRNQLRNALQVGVINTYAFRPPSRLWGVPFPGEYCLNGCEGDYGERRVFDLTLTGELALATHMRRASGGVIARLGYGFPDVLNAKRIPTTRPGIVRAVQKLGDFVERHQPWFHVFLAQDGRRVWHNAFLEGTGADDGPDGWRTISQIAPRPSVGETSWGWSVGFSSLTVTYQNVLRTTEYDSDGGRHRFGSVSIALTTLARAGG